MSFIYICVHSDYRLARGASRACGLVRVGEGGEASGGNQSI